MYCAVVNTNAGQVALHFSDFTQRATFFISPQSLFLFLGRFRTRTQSQMHAHKHIDVHAHTQLCETVVGERGGVCWCCRCQMIYKEKPERTRKPHAR